MLPTRWSKNLRGPSGGLSDKPGKARKMLEAAKAAADPLLIEGIWRTQAQSHTSFEPHAAVAQFNGEHLTVYLSTQAVHEHAKLIAEKYGLPAENVRVIADHVGGGFGSKGALRAEAFAAIELARAANAPVRVVLDRHEELSVTGYRPGAELVGVAAAEPRRRTQSTLLEGLCRHGSGRELNHRGTRTPYLSSRSEGTDRL